jgi:heat shock protein HtpX
MSCPVCGTTLPVNEGFTTWCENCDWNVVIADNRKRTMIERIYESIGDRHGESLFQSIKNVGCLFSKRILPRTIAGALSALAVILPIAFLFLSVSSFATYGFKPWTLILSAVVVPLAILALPRFRKCDKRKILDRNRYPEVYSYVNSIAERAGLKYGPRSIIINEDFNASVGRYGIEQRVILNLGLPLLSILDPGERTALIAHEVAHLKNKDVNTSVFVANAITTYGNWSEVLPRRLFVLSTPVAGLLILPFIFPFWLIGRFAWLLAFVLIHALWIDGQKAEYLADHVASRIAGKHNVESSLMKTYRYPTVLNAIQSTAVAHERIDLFDEIQRRMSRVPDREIKRIKRLDEMSKSRIDSFHPPTHYRIRVVAEHGEEALSAPVLVDEAALNRELRTKNDEIQEMAVSEYRLTLYRH